jgi:hypothetical protein
MPTVRLRSIRRKLKKHLLYEADFGTNHRNGGMNVFTYPTGKLLISDRRGVASRAYGAAMYMSAPF